MEQGGSRHGRKLSLIALLQGKWHLQLSSTSSSRTVPRLKSEGSSSSADLKALGHRVTTSLPDLTLHAHHSRALQWDGPCTLSHWAAGSVLGAQGPPGPPAAHATVDPRNFRPHSLSWASCGTSYMGTPADCTPWTAGPPSMPRSCPSTRRPGGSAAALHGDALLAQRSEQLLSRPRGSSRLCHKDLHSWRTAANCGTGRLQGH